MNGLFNKKEVYAASFNSFNDFVKRRFGFEVVNFHKSVFCDLSNYKSSIDYDYSISANRTTENLLRSLVSLGNLPQGCYLVY